MICSFKWLLFRKTFPNLKWYNLVFIFLLNVLMDLIFMPRFLINNLWVISVYDESEGYNIFHVDDQLSHMYWKDQGASGLSEALVCFPNLATKSTPLIDCVLVIGITGQASSHSLLSLSSSELPLLLWASIWIWDYMCPLLRKTLLIFNWNFLF